MIYDLRVRSSYLTRSVMSLAGDVVVTILLRRGISTASIVLLPVCCDEKRDWFLFLVYRSGAGTKVLKSVNYVRGTSISRAIEFWSANELCRTLLSYIVYIVLFLAAL